MLACPITNQVKGYPFEVAVPARRVATGVILADHLKSIDWKARNAERLGHCTDQVLDDFIERAALEPFLDGDSADQAIDAFDVCGAAEQRTRCGRGRPEAFGSFGVLVEGNKVAISTNSTSESMAQLLTLARKSHANSAVTSQSTECSKVHAGSS